MNGSQSSLHTNRGNKGYIEHAYKSESIPRDMSQFMRSIRFIEYNTIGKEKTENQKMGTEFLQQKKGINIFIKSIN